MVALVNTSYCVSGLWLVMVPIWAGLVIPLSLALARDAGHFWQLGKRASTAAWFVLGVVTLPGAVCAVVAGMITVGIAFAEGLLTGHGAGFPPATSRC